jgi:hypothetical protein
MLLKISGTKYSLFLSFLPKKKNRCTHKKMYHSNFLLLLRFHVRFCRMDDSHVFQTLQNFHSCNYSIHFFCPHSHFFIWYHTLIHYSSCVQHKPLCAILRLSQNDCHFHFLRNNFKYIHIYSTKLISLDRYLYLV